jgi:hypothetical protein
VEDGGSWLRRSPRTPFVDRERKLGCTAADVHFSRRLRYRITVAGQNAEARRQRTAGRDPHGL